MVLTIFKRNNWFLTNSFGIYKKYYKGGQLKSECNYIDGKKNGIEKYM